MARRLIMLRHGQTTYNASHRMQGHLDTELSDLGRDQARRAAGLLAQFDVVRVISSDLSRAAETAAIVGRRLGVEVECDARLRETHLGDWQGCTGEEVDRDFPGARALWRHDARWAPPGGESRLEVAQRAEPVVAELMSSWPAWENHTLLLVAHGGAISALTGKLLDLSAEQYPLLSGLGNAGWVQLTARPRFCPEHPLASEQFSAQTVDDAQWYLDSWNRGADLKDTDNADLGETENR